MSAPPRPAVAALPGSSRRRVWPLVAAGAVVLAMAVVGQSFDVGRHLDTAREWTAALGALAPAAYVVVYVAATLVGVPGLPFTVLSPFLFGPALAIGVMVVGSAVSAGLAFLIARFLARDLVSARLGATEGVARLAALVERHDWAVIPFLRIVPLAPFAVVNYGFGLTGISFWRYFGWSLLAMVPMNVLLVSGAGLVADAFHGGASWLLLAAAAVAAGALGLLAAHGRRVFTRS
jgi:uncharacterized membrane protein YdjX (TVP38/TMEM64 family)